MGLLVQIQPAAVQIELGKLRLHKSPHFIVGALCCWFLLSMGTASAQSDPPDLPELPASSTPVGEGAENMVFQNIPSVFGAVKYDQKVTEAPASITIITADQIKKYGYRSFTQILDSVPGFFTTNDRNYDYVGIRGFNRPGDYNSRVLLLIDHTDAEATVRFEVQDTGIGLSPDAQGRLFQSFSQADSSTTRKYGGTGLGLAICKQLTERMGGQIGVDSRPGEGSTFWFTVQLGIQPQGTPSVLDLASRDLRGLQLCIVDDYSTNRWILELYATKWGVRCLLAEDGPQALALLREAAARGHACDLAIIDMQMPGMDGLELARAIKADPALAPIRLVLLTSQGQRGDATAAQAAGYVAYLTKPVRESLLYECLLAVVTPPAQVPAREGHSAARTARPTLVTRHGLAEANARATPKILVAEDNAVNQKVAVCMLEKLGYRVDLVANGLEALDALRRIPYAAILMDCQMPEMDGFAATAEIRRCEARGEGQEAIVRSLTSRHVPIIAMTANARQEDRDRCLAAGMDDYLSKPVNLKVLGEVLARWITVTA